jgi:hypothetical protein
MHLWLLLLQNRRTWCKRRFDLSRKTASIDREADNWKYLWIFSCSDDLSWIVRKMTFHWLRCSESSRWKNDSNRDSDSNASCRSRFDRWDFSLSNICRWLILISESENISTFLSKNWTVIEIHSSWTAFRMICCSIESWRRFMINDECWNLSLWNDFWILSSVTASEQSVDAAELRTTECSTHCIHYASVDNESRANVFERTWRLLNERWSSDRLWRFVWWRTCILVSNLSSSRSNLNKLKCDCLSKNDASCSRMHWFMILE